MGQIGGNVHRNNVQLDVLLLNLFSPMCYKRVPDEERLLRRWEVLGSAHVSLDRSTPLSPEC